MFARGSYDYGMVFLANYSYTNALGCTIRALGAYAIGDRASGYVLGGNMLGAHLAGLFARLNIINGTSALMVGGCAYTKVLCSLLRDDCLLFFSFRGFLA